MSRPIVKPKNEVAMITALRNALRNEAGIYTFEMNQSYKPKYSAQHALRGKCHYVDDDALSFFNAKINDADRILDGLFYWIRESKDTSFDGDCREHDFVYFDLFGSVVEEMRIKSAESVSCSNVRELMKSPQALFDIDVVDYYATRLLEKKGQAEDEVKNLGNAIDQIARGACVIGGSGPSATLLLKANKSEEAV